MIYCLYTINSQTGQIISSYCYPVQKTRNLIRCCDCKYWSGQVGSHSGWSQPIESKVLICAVRGCPQPSASELDVVDGRLAYAKHDCSDFEPKLIMSSNVATLCSIAILCITLVILN